jgi:hypothetical protein
VKSARFTIVVFARYGDGFVFLIDNDSDFRAVLDFKFTLRTFNGNGARVDRDCNAVKNSNGFITDAGPD